MKPKALSSRLAAACAVVCTTPFLFAGTTWDGGAGDDLFGSGANWNPDGAPSPGSTTDLTFGGTTRLTPNNNYTNYDDFRNLDFAAGAGSFVISGNPIDIFGRVENQSTNLQTLSIVLAVNAGQPKTGEFNPVNGDLLINGSDVFTNGNTLQIWGSNGKTVTFNTVISQGGGITVNQNSNVVLLGANTYTGATAINAGTLTVGNGGTTGQLGSGGAVSIASGSSLTFNRSDAIAVTNGISGVGSVIQSGGGTLTFAAQKTYTGGTTINGGILDLTGGGGSSGTLRGTVTVNSGGTLRMSAGDVTGYGTGTDRISSLVINGGTVNVNTTSNQTFSNMAITMTGGTISGISGSNFDFFSGSSSLTTLASANTATVSMNARLRQASTTFTVADGAATTDLLWSGQLNQDTGGRNFIKDGAGRMDLTGVGSYSGTTTINGGTLRVTSNLQGTSSVTANAGTTFDTAGTNVFSTGHGSALAASRVVTLNNATWLMSGGESRIGNITLNNGSTINSSVTSGWGMLLGNTADGNAANINVTGTGASTMNGSGAIRLQGVQNFNVADTTTSSATDLTVSLILQNNGNQGGAAGGINKTGAGTMLLSNLANDFAGNVTVTGGTLVTGTAQGGGTTGYLGAVNGTKTVTVESGATLDLRANNIFGGSGKTAATIPNIVINNGGTLTSTRFNIVGNVTLNGGTLTQSATDTGSYQGYQFLGTITAGGSSGSTISTGNGKANHLRGGATTTFNVADATGNSAADLIVSAPLTNGSGDYAGTGSLEKSGAGTMRLDGVNTYTGTTSVTGGTLALGSGGSIATSSSINVAISTTLDVSAVSGGWTLGSAQTLTGVGTVAGNATILGDLRTGNSAGTMNFSGNLGLGSGADWFVEIGGTTTADYDRALVSGNFAVNGLISLALINGYTPVAGDSFQIASFTSFTDNGYSFDFSSAGLSPGLGWDTSHFQNDGTVSVIPEPGVFWICGLGGVAALLRRRRN